MRPTRRLGITYEARATLELRAAQGRRGEWSGVVSGDATRYGKKLSVEKPDEVLSDALAEA